MMASAKLITALTAVLGLATLLVSAASDELGGLSPAPTSRALPEPEAIVPTVDVQVRVREGEAPLPTDCGADEALAIMTGFIDAFNRGDRVALAGFFPAEAAGRDPLIGPGEFGWFAVTGRAGSFNPGFGAFSRDELLPYLAERHAHRERLLLLHLDVGGDWRPGVLAIVFDLRRQADDLPSHVAGGKGSLHCGTGMIMVWNLGDREGLPDFSAPRATCPADRPNCE